MPAPCRHARGIAAALVVCCWTVAASAAESGGATRSGGLVPSPRKTREELVRQWDLNSDGKIDQGEAEVAAARMRRERAELRLNSGIDPVTGRPRGEDVEPENEASEAEDVDPEPMEEPPAEDADEAPRRPGTGVPRSRVPSPSVGSAAAAAKTAGTGRSARTGVNAGIEVKRQPMTGGVRAGGMPARPGYGADLPEPSLNAGLPIAPKGRVAAPPPTPRAGVVPGARPAVTTPRPAPVRPPVNRGPYDPY